MPNRSALSEDLEEWFSSTNFFWTFAFAALTVYVVLSLVHSTYGSGFLAVRDDEIAAEAMGINTTKYKVLAFVSRGLFRRSRGRPLRTLQAIHSPGGFQFPAIL